MRVILNLDDQYTYYLLFCYFLITTGIIVLGAFIFIMSFLGCAAAWRESRLFLGKYNKHNRIQFVLFNFFVIVYVSMYCIGIYFLLLLLFTIILLAVGIAVYAKSEDALKYIQDGWRNAPLPVRADLQQQLYCCGLSVQNDTFAAQPCPRTLPGQQDPPARVDTLRLIFKNTYAQVMKAEHLVSLGCFRYLRYFRC